MVLTPTENVVWRLLVVFLSSRHGPKMILNHIWKLTAYHIMYLRHASGYYYNMNNSSLIVVRHMDYFTPKVSWGCMGSEILLFGSFTNDL